MTEHNVIRADFSNWRPVAGRKVLQLILEVPIEQTAEVMQRLGVPMPGESKWCAVALLKENSPVAQRSEPPAHNGLVAGSNPAGATKDRKPFHTLPLSQQAALRCQDDAYRSFLAQKDGPGPFLMFDTSMAADEVRHICGVTSRAQLDDERRASSRHAWTELESQYQAWLTDSQYAEARR